MFACMKDISVSVSSTPQIYCREHHIQIPAQFHAVIESDTPQHHTVDVLVEAFYTRGEDHSAGAIQTRFHDQNSCSN